ncbi:MAG: hypothetical protein R3315_12365 [Woeseiaceae bacterium]|nr:hypothetical protein [Woeseiaceae bacterium]
MNKRSQDSTLILLVAVSLPACAPQNPAIADYDCEIVSIPACTGNPQSITINTNPNNKVVAPPNYCAGPNETITFKVTPTNSAKRSVAVVPKSPGDIWMIGTNDPNANEFSIETPASEGEYGYTVIFADGTCIDPRITVE